MKEQVGCVDKETLVSFLYGECKGDERASVEAHLASCPACGAEVAALGGVREALAQWVPPAAGGGFRIVREEEAAAAAARVLRPARWWQRTVPALGRAAAAVLLFAGGAALANLDVRYGPDGVVVRTGWQREAAPAVQAAAGSTAGAPAASEAPRAASAPWRADLVALERQIRGEMSSQLAAARPSPVAPGAVAGFDERRLMSQVRSIVDTSISDSERRQQREFAYRLTQLQSEVGAQRQADFIRLQQGMWGLQGRTGAEVAQQRQLINLLIRAQQK